MQIDNPTSSMKLRVCLFTVFENYFLFSKVRRRRKTEKICLVSSLFIFSSKKHKKTQKKTLNLKNKEFLENTFLVFSKTVLKNNVQKQERTSPNCNH